jgi:hypothetical protein
MTVLYKRRPDFEAKAMTDITYDAEADAVYITVGDSRIDRTEETGPFIYDVDAEGHIVGIRNPFRQQGSRAGRLEKTWLAGRRRQVDGWHAFDTSFAIREYGKRFAARQR